MTLQEMKNAIINSLYDYKAYELPKICLSLGLSDGTINEAYESKKKYVSERIKLFTKSQIIQLLSMMKEKLNIVLLPEDKYEYKLTNVTKSEITQILKKGFDVEQWLVTQNFHINWNGKLEEIDFIKRICDISKIIVEDKRCSSFEEEYYRHRIQNSDYNDDYFFEMDRLPYKNCKEQVFFDILCEIFHPEVRDENGNWREVKNEIEKFLNEDGFKFYVSDKISGREVFSIKKITFLDEKINFTGIKKIEEKINSDYIKQQILILNDSINTNSTSAIGKAKELLETTYKFILDELNIEYNNTDKLNVLNKKVTEVLKLNITDQNKQIPGVVNILSGLVNITQGLATLRNDYGDGHGKSKAYKELPLRYGCLAVGSVSVYIEFLLDTYEDKFLKK